MCSRASRGVVIRDEKQKGLKMCSQAISELWQIKMKNIRFFQLNLGPSRGCVRLRLEVEKRKFQGSQAYSWTCSVKKREDLRLISVEIIERKCVTDLQFGPFSFKLYGDLIFPLPFPRFQLTFQNDPHVVMGYVMILIEVIYASIDVKDSFAYPWGIWRWTF